MDTGVTGLKKKIENQCYMKFELEFARPSLKVPLTVSPQLLSYIMTDNEIHDLKHLTIRTGQKKIKISESKK